MDENTIRTKKQIIGTYILLVCNCLSPLALIVIAPSLPQIQEHFAGVDHVEFLVPLALTVPTVIVALLCSVCGGISDKLGRKNLLLGALVGYGLLGLLPLALASLYSIIASRIILGFFEAMIMAISVAMIGDYYTGHLRRKYLAMQVTFASGSAVLFFMIGGFLGSFGWRVPFTVYAISLLMAVAAAYFLWEPDRSPHAEQDDSNETVAEVSRFRPGLMFWIYGVTCISGVTFMIFQVQIAYILDILGNSSPASHGLVAAIFSACIVAGTLSIPQLLKRGLRISYSLALAFGLQALSCILIPHAADTTDVLLISLINGFGLGLLVPSLSVWNMRELPQHRRGVGSGAWFGSWALGNFAGPLVVVAINKVSGGVITTVGWFGWAMVLMTIFAVLCALATRTDAGKNGSMGKLDGSRSKA